MKLQPLPPPPPQPRAVEAVLADVRMMQDIRCDFDQSELLSVLDEVAAITGKRPKVDLENLFDALPSIEAALTAKLTPSTAQQTTAIQTMQNHTAQTHAQSDQQLVDEYGKLTDFREKSLFLAKHGARLRELIRDEQAARLTRSNPSQGNP